ncbi:DUF349 domain-containing protein [Maribellus sediminis]|uniref:DUF349 domain-containing protein n=1 Tax=Maribellus sediminis TaxID=2696285 RepID=UPI0014313401|nr:DUF349 domain-containing protein [Maribellus sediminis]
MEPKDLKNSDELKSPEKEDLKKENVTKPVTEEVKKEEPVQAEPAPEQEKEKEEAVKTTASDKIPIDTVPESVPVIEAISEEETPAPKKAKKDVEEEETSEKTVPIDTVPESVPVIEEVAEEETPAPKKEKKEVATETTAENTVPIDTVPESVPVIEDEVVEETPAPKKEKKEEATEASAENSVPIDTVPESVPVIEDEVAEETPAPKKEKKEEKKEAPKEKTVPIDTVPESVPVIEEATKEETPEETKEKDVSVEAPKKEKKVEEKVDYTKFSQIELVNAMRDVLGESDDRDVKADVDAMKAAFYKNMKDAVEEAKKQFIEAGGAEEDFVEEEDPYENDIKDLLKEYRQIRIEYSKKHEQEKEENLAKKYEVIEKIKGLINNEESINKTFNEFRSLQQEWREIGLVPQSKMKTLWDTYHFHVENFYDYVKINRELRDLDLKKNLEAKIKLCEKAEELLLDSSIIRAFNTLQKYHEQWREIGPVPREQKDDIWERFKAATTKINKKHQEFFEERKQEQKNNLDAKTALCEKVEAIKIDEIDSHKEWDKHSKELVELQKVWRTIGFAPRKDNNRIYDRFRSACDRFFDAKRAFYSKNKEEQQNNLQLKIDLCVQAESLKDSNDWKKTTQDLIEIQKKWKEIGPVPRKQSDSIWKRFRTACDYFFDKKSEHFSEMDTEQVDNLKLKEDLIEEIKNFKSSKDVENNLDRLKEFQRRWAEIGHVPFKKKDEIQVNFREAINKLYDDLKIDDEQRNLLKFRTKMTTYSESSRGQNKMRFERDKYMNKMKQLENDLVLLDNNIGFFAESKNAESLIKDVQKKIEMTKQKIELLKEKIRVIDEVDENE